MRLKPLILGALLAAGLSSPLLACADGPDSYRVVGVAADDVLNVRSVPSLGFSVIGALPHDATGVQNIDSVPVHSCDGNVDLTPFEQNNRWTKVVWDETGDYVFGWVKSVFLAE